jgi:hypothetical protein
MKGIKIMMIQSVIKVSEKNRYRDAKWIQSGVSVISSKYSQHEKFALSAIGRMWSVLE